MARKRVIDVTTATRTLSRNENGSLVVLNRAGGITVTLPSASRGLEFQFVAKAAGDYTIDAGTDTIRGALVVAFDDTASKSFTANPASTVKIEMETAAVTGGSGGAIGTNFSLVCDTDGIWTAYGATVHASTTGEITPFSA